MLYSSFPTEQYHCPSCQKQLSDEGLYDDWKCPVCGTSVHIKAEDHNGVRHVIERVSPSELKENSQVVLPGSGFTYIYPVIDVRKEGSDYAVPLRGYRVIKLKPTDRVNRVIGAW